MYKQSYGTCRGCGKQILWTRTPAGKKMPCDPEVIFFTHGGKETFVTPEGAVTRGERGKEGQIGYVPHWATCSEWKRFKK